MTKSNTERFTDRTPKDLALTFKLKLTESQVKVMQVKSKKEND